MNYQKFIINDHLHIKSFRDQNDEEEYISPPQSEEWSPPIDQGEPLADLIRKCDLNNPKYDWRKNTKLGRFSNKNFGIFLFNIL